MVSSAADVLTSSSLASSPSIESKEIVEQSADVRPSSSGNASSCALSVEYEMTSTPLGGGVPKIRGKTSTSSESDVDMKKESERIVRARIDKSACSMVSKIVKSELESESAGTIVSEILLEEPPSTQQSTSASEVVSKRSTSAGALKSKEQMAPVRSEISMKSSKSSSKSVDDGHKVRSSHPKKTMHSKESQTLESGEQDSSVVSGASGRTSLISLSSAPTDEQKVHLEYSEKSMHSKGSQTLESGEQGSSAMSGASEKISRISPSITGDDGQKVHSVYSEKSGSYVAVHSGASVDSEKKSSIISKDAAAKAAEIVLSKEVDALVDIVISKVLSTKGILTPAEAKTASSKSCAVKEIELNPSKAFEPGESSSPIETVVSEMTSDVSVQVTPGEVQSEAGAVKEEPKEATLSKSTSVVALPPNIKSNSGKSSHSATAHEEVETIPSEASLHTPTLSSEIHSADTQDLLSTKKSGHKASTESKSGSPSDTGDAYSEDFEDEFPEAQPTSLPPSKTLPPTCPVKLLPIAEPYTVCVFLNKFSDTYMPSVISNLLLFLLSRIESKADVLMDEFMDLWLEDFIDETIDDIVVEMEATILSDSDDYVGYFYSLLLASTLQWLKKQFLYPDYNRYYGNGGEHTIANCAAIQGGYVIFLPTALLLSTWHI